MAERSLSRQPDIPNLPQEDGLKKNDDRERVARRIAHRLVKGAQSA
jgi:hypothetical protein